MAKEIINIDSSADQKHTVLFEESEVIVRLRFMPTMQYWFLSCEYNNKITNNVKLSLGVHHMVSRNYPFDFALIGNGDGIDPFRIDDFESGRIRLLMLEPSDMEEIRGIPVEI